MRLLIFFVIAVILIAFLGTIAQALVGEIAEYQEKVKKEEIEETTKKGISTSDLKAQVIPENKESLSVETWITKGPEEGETIENNIVIFEFDSNYSIGEGLLFETKLEGLDNDWKATRKHQRTITLPGGNREYTFLVRAKKDGFVDQTPAERTFKMEVSPYFGKVTIASVSFSSKATIRLKTNLSEGEEINITGWKIKGKVGTTEIPQGIERYLPGYNIANKDIILGKGDIAFLSEASNPLGRDRSFKENICFGYLATEYSFPTPVGDDCPVPTEEEVSELKVCCRNFIKGIRNGCKVPDYRSNEKIFNDEDCVFFIKENFNYEGCFVNFSKEENFLTNRWHIFLRTTVTTKNYCDTLYLRDSNGLLVDSYSYGKDLCK